MCFSMVSRLGSEDAGNVISQTSLGNDTQDDESWQDNYTENGPVPIAARLRAAPEHRDTRLSYLQYSYKCLNTTARIESRSIRRGPLHLTDKLTINISVENFTNQSRHVHRVDALYPYYRRSISDFFSLFFLVRETIAKTRRSCCDVGSTFRVISLFRALADCSFLS